jgi:hypothetical protein
LPTTTIGFGVVLILIGLVGYFGTGMVSPTALIPAAFGLLLTVFGVMARDDKKRKMAMHIAVTVGLLGFLGTVPGLLKIGTLLFRRRGGAAGRRHRAIHHGRADGRLRGHVREVFH